MTDFSGTNCFELVYLTHCCGRVLIINIEDGDTHFCSWFQRVSSIMASCGAQSNLHHGIKEAEIKTPDQGIVPKGSTSLWD